MRLRWPVSAAVLMCALGCGGHGAGSGGGFLFPTPTAPTGNGLTATLRVVGTLTDEPVSGASASGGSIRSTVSDGSGVVTLEAAGAGSYAVSVSAAQFVTRQTTVSIPDSEARLCGGVRVVAGALWQLVEGMRTDRLHDFRRPLRPRTQGAERDVVRSPFGYLKAVGQAAEGGPRDIEHAELLTNRYCSPR